MALGGCSSGLSYNGKLDDLARHTEAHEGVTAWAEDVVKVPNDPRISQYVFPAGKPKCNLFVCDMCYNIGITPPLTSDGKWPITAQMWTGDVPGFTQVSAIGPGCIVSNGSHVGIAISKTRILAANKTSVGGYKLSGTIQRYDND